MHRNLFPVDGRGLVDPDDVKRAMRPETKLVSIMFANNETGVLQPVNAIGKIAAEADIYFHTDAVQAAGKVALDVKEIALRFADHLGAQVPWPARYRSAFCPQRNSSATPGVWWAARAFAPGRDREPGEHRRIGKGVRNRACRILPTAASRNLRRCATGWRLRSGEHRTGDVNSAVTARMPNTSNIASIASKAKPW